MSAILNACQRLSVYPLVFKSGFGKNALFVYSWLHVPPLRININKRSALAKQMRSIINKFPENKIEAISVGPDVKNPHTVQEFLGLPSCVEMYKFLLTLVAELAK